MKKFITLLTFIAFALIGNAQVERYTAEGQAVDFQNKIILNSTIKNKSALLTDSTAVPLYDILYLKTTKAVNTVLPNGKVSGQKITIYMVTDGGDYSLVPKKLFLNDTIIFDTQGDYWEGVWMDTTWITLNKTATLK